MDAPFLLRGGGHFSIFFCAHQETQISFFLGAASVISRPVICQVSSAVSIFAVKNVCLEHEINRLDCRLRVNKDQCRGLFFS